LKKQLFTGEKMMQLNTPLFEPGNFVHIPHPNPAIITGKPGSWDDRACESGDIFKEKDTYYWYYHANKHPITDFGNYQIGVCTSQSPTGPWIRSKDNPILKLAENDWERDCVACPHVIKERNTYYMFYNGSIVHMPDLNEDCWTGIATANNPLGPWEKYENNPILKSEKVRYIGGILKVDSKYYMYASNFDEIQSDYGRMYMATADSITGPWFVRDTPVLTEGKKGSWDEAGFSEAKVFHCNGMFHMLYGGSCFTGVREEICESIGYAYSLDGMNWIKFPGNPLIPYQHIPNCSAMAEVHALLEPPYIYCYHTLRYLECPEGEIKEWFDEKWIEHLGIQVLELKNFRTVSLVDP